MTTVPPNATGMRAKLRRLSDRHPKLFVALHALAGLLAAAILLWIFGAIAEDLPEQGLMVHVDQAVTHFAQSHGTEWGEKFFVAVSWVGSQGLIVVVLISMVWFWTHRERAEAWAMLGAAGGGTLLNWALKTIFHRDRPEFASEFIKRTTYSFPSGHSMESIAGFGMLAYLLHRRARTRLQRRLLLVGTVLLVLAIGTSRVYLGVHYLSDVVAGYAAGAAWLLACIAAFRDSSAARRERAEGIAA